MNASRNAVLAGAVAVAFVFAATTSASAHKNGNGTLVRSSDQAGGIWAQSTLDATPASNQSYWYTY